MEGGSLPIATLQGIKELLEESGGQVSGGVVTTKFPGVKKMQLQEHFQVHIDKGRQYYLLSPDCEFDPAKVPPTKEERKDALIGGTKRKLDGDINEPVPLTDEQIETVRNAIAAHGGQIKGGRLASVVPGLKRDQLELHFELINIGTERDYWLAELGTEIHMVKSKPSGNARARRQKRPRVEEVVEDDGGPLLAPDMVEKVRDEINAHGGELDGGVISTRFPGMKKAHLADYFTVETVTEIGSTGKYKVRDEGPTPSIINEGQRPAPYKPKIPADFIPPDIVEEVRDEINTHGGEVHSDVITTKFPGMKKAHLYNYFTVEDEIGGSGKFKLTDQGPTPATLRPLHEGAPPQPYRRKGIISSAASSVTSRAPAMGSGQRTPQLGDWYCPNCGSVVFASRGACFKCGTPKLQASMFALAFQAFTGMPPPMFPLGMPGAAVQSGKGKSRSGSLPSRNQKNKTKKENSTESPEPLAPLNDEQVQLIRDLLSSHGGSMDGGVVSTMVPGLNKAQLEPHFLVENTVGVHGDYTVSLVA